MFATIAAGGIIECGILSEANTPINSLFYFNICTICFEFIFQTNVKMSSLYSIINVHIMELINGHQIIEFGIHYHFNTCWDISAEDKL